jgi:hypothetical protein
LRAFRFNLDCATVISDAGMLFNFKMTKSKVKIDLITVASEYQACYDVMFATNLREHWSAVPQPRIYLGFPSDGFRRWY